MTIKSYLLAGLTILGMILILWNGWAWWLSIPLAVGVIALGVLTER